MIFAQRLYWIYPQLAFPSRQLARRVGPIAIPSWQFAINKFSYGPVPPGTPYLVTQYYRTQQFHRLKILLTDITGCARRGKVRCCPGGNISQKTRPKRPELVQSAYLQPLKHPFDMAKAGCEQVRTEILVNGSYRKEPYNQSQFVAKGRSALRSHPK